MKTAILTGFEKFGSYAVNPTKTLTQDLNGRILAEHRIHSMVFSAAPSQLKDCGKEIVEQLLSVHASVIISFGMASEAKGVRVEMRCVNWVENDRYCMPFENRTPIFSDIPIHDVRCVPLEQWDLKAASFRLSAMGMSFETSQDAGRFCCNALMFRVLRALEEKSQTIPFLFVHIPCTEEAIATISDFDRAQKTLIQQSDLPAVVESLLKSYHQ